MTHSKKAKAILFDLDGTLLDTAQDLVNAINQLRLEHGLPLMPVEQLRHVIGLGSRSMLKEVLNIDEQANEFGLMRDKFIHYYLNDIARHTTLFPNMEKILNYLQKNNIVWGIVTNKHTHLTEALLKALAWEYTPHCIVCGDTLPYAKPNPAPILHACEALNVSPPNCLYLGDAITDVQASNKAGTVSLVALYGYISKDDHPTSWEAKGFIKDPLELFEWI